MRHVTVLLHGKCLHQKQRVIVVAAGVTGVRGNRASTDVLRINRELETDGHLQRARHRLAQKTLP